LPCSGTRATKNSFNETGIKVIRFKIIIIIISVLCSLIWLLRQTRGKKHKGENSKSWLSGERLKMLQRIVLHSSARVKQSMKIDSG
jgi:hypothetical protein